MTTVPEASSPSRRRLAAEVVLYLDLDGVVQHEAVMWHARRGIYMSPEAGPERTLFEWIPCLEEALAPFPQVALVLSSSWCVWPGYGKTLKRFPPELRDRFIGGTYHKRVQGADPWSKASFKAMSRGMQVCADVLRRKPMQWLALDDDTEDWPEWARNNLVDCDGATGLSNPRVQTELRLKLEQCFEKVVQEAHRRMALGLGGSDMGGSSGL